MMKNLMEVMKISISEVLETMFYLAVEFQNDLSPDKLEVIKKNITMGCKLHVSGSVSASFMLFIPDSLLLDMTQSFMGEDEENCTKEYLEGTLKETLNMIAGNALKSLETDESPDLHIPEIVEISEMDSGSLITIETTDGTMIMQVEAN
ncbi:MAG: chemotaxis protein CheX [Desulfobacteraceae bacterium]|nr:chemotaxis protein CheX [Desulfobacteraceae bacterium]